MTQAEIYRRLAEIFEDVFLRDDIVLKPHTTAADIAGWDSLKQIDIISTAQERFGVTFTTRDLDGLTCVGDLVRAIARRI
jgi:acyl carrier protein